LAQLDLSLDQAPPPAPRVLTVSQAVRAADRLLEQHLSSIWVEGEVSNLRVAASGHAFFTLKDDEAVLPAAMWRSSLRRLRFELENGQRLRAFGRLGIYDRQGRFQLYVDRAEPSGLGELMLRLEQVKTRLAAEGLFDAERKRPLPAWPAIVGVVTSASGAAIHDVLKVARRRCPSRIVLVPASVQGDEAPASLVTALERIQRMPGIDVVIVGRGGGSSEDLWAFNDEELARTVARARVPVVSAVGHEIDTTICDLVADVRAATPSHAAELVVPDRARYVARLVELGRRLFRALERRLLDERARLDHALTRLAASSRTVLHRPRIRLDALGRRLERQHPRARLARNRRRLDLLRGALRSRGDRFTRRARLRLVRMAGALEALSPLAALRRGYSVVVDGDGRVVTDADQVAVGDEVELRLSRGRLWARVVARHDD
jgi:exodeoxyribonuclease VII large subunit